ncbi:MAG: hypothetical protein QME66_04385 [Candidatus Eisenbacteria bacterium]|nr:hypothetical protein [Candidatus Eisenbacteria bacterium]
MKGEGVMTHFSFASQIRTITLFTFAAAFLVIGTVSQSYGEWSGSPNVNTPICTASGGQTDPKIIGDGAGGAIITWYDNRSGSYDIYAQRINASGIVQWTANGVVICTAATYQFNPTIASDGSGGAIIT